MGIEGDDEQVLDSVFTDLVHDGRYGGFSVPHGEIDVKVELFFVQCRFPEANDYSIRVPLVAL